MKDIQLCCALMNVVEKITKYLKGTFLFGSVFVVISLLIASCSTFNNPYNNDFKLADFGVRGYSCNAELMKPSRTIPINVNSVRPADIKVVMALGDSITAGNGAGAIDPVEVLLQYRGLAFQAGGDKTLDEHVTIPNILKKYNSDLFGYSKGIGSPNVWEIARLNVAMPGANADDLPRQARELVGLLEEHPESVNMKDDWKLLNIFIGGNDICEYCTNPAYAPKLCIEHVKEAIQIIYDKVPRVIVSLTTMLHLELLRKTDHGHFFCTWLHREECGCESNKTFTDADIAKACVDYSNYELELGASGDFEKDDFTLVVQPFFKNIVTPPMKALRTHGLADLVLYRSVEEVHLCDKESGEISVEDCQNLGKEALEKAEKGNHRNNGKYNMEIFAPDCFHFSQYGHALVSTWLWKNILEPVGNKTAEGSLSDPALPLACPDTSCPFIRTNLNSENCSKYMTTAA